MADTKVKKAKSSKPKKSTKLKVEKAPKHDSIFYAHVEKENKKFMADKAAAQSVSVSTLTNKLFNELRAGKSVSL